MPFPPLTKTKHGSWKAARLLGRVRESLEVFHAPPKSFALSSLAPLSKCHRLTLLDLSLVTDRLALSTLSSTFSHLHAVRTLHLSRSISHSIRDHYHLPPNLIHLKTSGPPPCSPDHLAKHPPFFWPDTLTTLTIIGCEVLASAIFPQYSRLTHLNLIDCFYNPPIYVLDSIFCSCTSLVFLSAPGRSFDSWRFTFPSTPAPLPLRTIEMGHSSSIVPAFAMDEFADVVKGPLANLRVLRVHSGLCGDQGFFARDLDLAELLLIKRAEEAGERVEEDEVGVVFFD